MAFTAWTYADRATANSYATVAEFDTFLGDRLNAPTISTDTEKQKLLMAATARIDQETFEGLRTYTDGVLAFPRTGLYHDGFEFDDYTLPDDLKKAVFECAIYYNEVDTTKSDDEANYKSAQVGELAVVYKDSKPSTLEALTPSVWQYLNKFLASQGMRLSR